MHFLTTGDGKYRIESLTAATLPSALSLIKDHFCQDEFACIGTEMNKNPLAAEELLELCADAALDGISVVAVEIKSGEVASALFNKLQVAPSVNSEKGYFQTFLKERCKQASSRAFIDFMRHLDDKCKFFEKYGVDCGIEFMILGTHRAHRRNQLAKLVVKTTIDLAKKFKRGPFSPMTVQDLGPKYAFITPRTPTTKEPKICTGLWTAIGSQRVGRALGLTVLLTVSLKDFVFDGKSYADRIGAETFCECGVKRID